MRLVRTATLWRLRVDRGTMSVTLSDAFAAAPPEVIEALVLWALGRDGGRGRAVTESFLQSRPRPAPPAGEPAAAAGIHHDLDRVFVEVNRAHFAGDLERPRLQWTRGPTYHRFGYYVYTEDRLVVSASLDRPEVPGFVVEFVVFHELLHKALGLTGSGTGSRRRAHTRAFRARERDFPRFAEASDFLDRLARRLST